MVTEFGPYSYWLNPVKLNPELFFVNPDRRRQGDREGGSGEPDDPRVAAGVQGEGHESHRNLRGRAQEAAATVVGLVTKCAGKKRGFWNFLLNYYYLF